MAERFPTWTNFKELIDRAVPVSIAVTGKPDVYLYVGEGGRSIGLRVAASTDAELEPPPLAEVEVGLINADGRRLIQVSTAAGRTFEAFYGLLCTVADRIQLNRDSVTKALAESLDMWFELLRPVPILSQAEQVGLWGELWALERLISARGASLIDAWTGPLDGGEPHDLRLGEVEVEVKTSTSRTRVHMFNGVRQLEPSPGHELYVLSLLIEPAGAMAGHSLPDLVESVRALVAGDTVRLGALDRNLGTVGYREADRVHYRTSYQLRSPAVLILVGPDFPAITVGVVSALGVEYRRRLREVHYSLDLEGLGDADGSETFLEVLPEPSLDV